MYIEWKSRNRTARRAVNALLVAALAFGLIFAAPGLSGAAADPVDLNAACSLKALAGNEIQTADLAGRLRIDLYPVAIAKPVNGQDAYTYEFLTGYEGVEKIYNQKEPDWPAMAQKAAELIFTEDSGIQPAASGMAEEQIPNLGCGLYLVIARGEGLGVDEYKTTVKQKNEAGEVQENIATLAYSDTHTYTYAPELVSLPGKQAAAEDGTIQNVTSGDGEWLYQMTVTLKPEEDIRYGSLEIIKRLETYEAGGEATFIFQVEAVQNGENVYSDVVPITFTSAGEKAVLVDRIPVGAQVTVEEVYHGANYRMESVSDSKSLLISAEDVVSVTFVNDYDETDRGGGAITNRFEYSEAEGWNWQKIPENESTDGE